MKRNQNKFTLILALIVVILSKLVLFAQNQSQQTTAQNNQKTMADMPSVNQTHNFELSAGLAKQVPELKSRLAVYSYVGLPKYGYLELDGDKAGSVEFNTKPNQDFTLITIGTLDRNLEKNNVLISQCGFGQVIALLSGITS